MSEPTAAHAIRRAVTDALLDHVPFDGWSWAAFDRAVEDTGADPVLARNAMPHGPADALAEASRRADAAMLAALDNPAPQESARDALARAIRLRLDHNAGREDTVRLGLAYLAMPGMQRLSVRLLNETVDALRAAAGDGAAGLRGLGRRGVLAGVYTGTLLVWLTDTSDGRDVTWDFLGRRLDAVMGAGAAGDRGLRAAARAPELLRRAAARQVAGM